MINTEDFDNSLKYREICLYIKNYKYDLYNDISHYIRFSDNLIFDFFKDNFNEIIVTRNSYNSYKSNTKLTFNYENNSIIKKWEDLNDHSTYSEKLDGFNFISSFIIFVKQVEGCLKSKDHLYYDVNYEFDEKTLNKVYQLKLFNF